MGAFDRVEMLLYHELDETGSIEVSTTSSSGPWTKVTLTSTQRIGAALTEWAELANVALPAGGWDFGEDGESLYFGGAGWVKLSPCLADMLGFSEDHGDMVAPWVLATSSYSYSDVPGLGYFLGFATTKQFVVGLASPVEVETGELVSYRGGRAATDHYGRVSEVEVDFYVAPELWSRVRLSPVLSGHAAFWLAHDIDGSDGANFVPEPYSDDNRTGALTLYPFEPPTIQQDSEDDPVWNRLRCTRADAPEAVVEDLSDDAYFYRTGADGLLTLATLISSSAVATTLMFWMRAQLCSSAGDLVTNLLGFDFEVDNSAGANSGPDYAFGTGPGLSAGSLDAWSHMAFVCSGGTLTLRTGTENLASVTTIGSQPGTPISVLAGKLFRGCGRIGDIANISIFERALTTNEQNYARVANRKHDLRLPSGSWPGETPWVLLRRGAVDGAVSNDGSGGPCRLVFSGDANSYVDTGS